MTRRGPYGPSTIASSPITLARIRSSSGEVGRPTSPTRGGEAVTAVSLLGCQGGPASVDVHAAAQPTQVLGASEAREALPEHGRGTAFTGHPTDAVDYIIPVDRAVQLAAIAAHASQAVPASVLWQRLARLGSVEHLRWLRRSVNVDTSRTALTSEGVIPR